ncbi:prepilin-type N-terminal cleavage/methylation domain-containing protein [Cellulomonas sp. NTE-D12]|uniref:PilW family protein n=1 Tax=Cellulomonas sp. NTE-D12 TaxID=2962632 RepID=UPI0030814A3F|nr:hypothetical protein CELD12_18200 [Cellulomonas sp. NTE-D12]
MAEHRGRARRDKGTTLVELIVSMTIFGVVIALVMGAVISLMTASNGAFRRADAQSEIRSGLSDISKQMRSGNVLFSPKDEPTGVPSCVKAADGSDRGSCMRIFTQTNGIPRCVQWQVLQSAPGGNGNSILRTRNWDPSWSSTNDVTAWRTVARGLTLDPANLPFTLEGATTPYDRRLLDVTLQSYDSDRRVNVSIASSISGRNTSYGYDTGRCNPVPAENWTP